MEGFDSLRTADGQTLSLSALEEGQVYISGASDALQQNFQTDREVGNLRFATLPGKRIQVKIIKILSVYG